MANGGDRRGTAWGQVALAILVLIVLAMVVSFVLRLIKLLVYAALLLIGVTVVMRALRSRR